ncbi:hypothetical protein DFH08DRAFT_894345 [Mycena albidolilacea]|uniref:Uncharacterized protein n=1 Tax=Mycena albidolilacea TaxID=1033008 RepID=A0AAD6ZC75_9AGAR|nr:hypothetical protein DFH08DRAFT_894345 [Mycena albidolilacea]
MRLGLLDTVTESGILVQDTAGLRFTEPANAALAPAVVQSCSFNDAGRAVCRVHNDGGATSTATIIGTRAPVFTFTTTLPAATAKSKASAGSNAGGSMASGPGSASHTGPPQTSSVMAQTSHKVPVGAVVGAATGGILLVLGALAGLLFCRRRRRRNGYLLSEKVELDPEPAHKNAFMQMDNAAAASSDSDSDSRPQPLPSSYTPSSADTLTDRAPTVVAFTDPHPPPPETPRQRRQRLKQMQVAVEHLQRNLSTREDDGAQSQIAAQQRQIDMLLDEVGHLRAIVAQDEALPAYEQ